MWPWSRVCMGREGRVTRRSPRDLPPGTTALVGPTQVYCPGVTKYILSKLRVWAAGNQFSSHLGILPPLLSQRPRCWQVGEGPRTLSYFLEPAQRMVDRQWEGCVSCFAADPAPTAARYGISPDSIVLYGQSIGTVPTVDLASRYECAAVVLHSPLTSGMRVAFPDTKKTYCFDAFPK